ncbi:hypothetical protein [Acidovorax sp. BL-A-41-H1]|uniref:hypothetical protein n=1 Tax=Acidovorax sp. BL-A-41-H1 TaxID=3421102 RepID=UPI003F7A18C2
MTNQNPLRDAQQRDKTRPGFPGEHWLVFGAGVLLMQRSGRSRSWISRTLGRAAGAALVARAASGQDGVLGKLGSLLAPQSGNRWNKNRTEGHDRAQSVQASTASRAGNPGASAPAAVSGHATPTQATGPYSTATRSAQNG